MLDSSIPAILRERASLQPNDPAFTFIDYDRDWEGVEETLTWGQLQQRVVALAAEIREHAQIGDRVVILAPQSMSYVLGFLASFEANVVAVPLSISRRSPGYISEAPTAFTRRSAPASLGLAIRTSMPSSTFSPNTRGSTLRYRRARLRRLKIDCGTTLEMMQPSMSAMVNP